MAAISEMYLLLDRMSEVREIYAGLFRSYAKYLRETAFIIRLM